MENESINESILELLLEESNLCYRCKKQRKLSLYFLKEGSYRRDNIRLLCSKCLALVKKSKEAEKPKDSYRGGGYLSANRNDMFSQWGIDFKSSEDKWNFASYIDPKLTDGRPIVTRTIKNPKVRSENGVLKGIYSEID